MAPERFRGATDPTELSPCPQSVHNREAELLSTASALDIDAMTPEPAPRPKLILRAGALAGGYTDGEIRRLRARGIWTLAMRGAYLPTQESERLEPAERHRIAMEVLRPRIAGDPVFSHLSAAVLYRLPLWRIILGPVLVTRSPPTRGHRGPRLHTHIATLEADEVAVVDGWPVTSVARTVLDLARTLPFEQALVIADAALHRKLTTADRLAAQLERSARLPGSVAAGRVIAFANGLSESVGESRSRIMIHQAGLPTPELQVEVLDRHGRFIARGDFGYRRQRVIGEFDGKIKYSGELNGKDDDPREVLWNEKLREDAVRDAGWSMVRWIWSDLDHPTDVIARLRRALARGGRGG